MSWLPDLGSPHHKWIVLDNGEHRCSCGWSPNYYRDVGLTWEQQVDLHKEKIAKLEAMEPRKMAEEIIIEVLSNGASGDMRVIGDMALELERWGFTFTKEAEKE